MNSKTDKEDRSCDDIVFLSEVKPFMFTGAAGAGRPIAARSAAKLPGGKIIAKPNTATARAPKASAPTVYLKTAAVIKKIYPL